MLLQLSIIFLIILICVVLLLLCRSKNETFHLSDPTYQFDLAYNNCYAFPRPRPTDECQKYNDWVDEANKCGQNVLTNCFEYKKTHPEVVCPRQLIWTTTKCHPKV